jgi:hypothetical protein
MTWVGESTAASLVLDRSLLFVADAANARRAVKAALRGSKAAALERAVISIFVVVETQLGSLVVVDVGGGRSKLSDA